MAMWSCSLIDFADGALENIEKYVNHDCYRPGFYANRYWLGLGNGFSCYDKKPERTIHMDWESVLYVFRREDLMENFKKAGVTSVTLRRDKLDENGDVVMDGTTVFTESFEVPIEELPDKEYFGILWVDMS